MLRDYVPKGIGKYVAAAATCLMLNSCGDGESLVSSDRADSSGVAELEARIAKLQGDLELAKQEERADKVEKFDGSPGFVLGEAKFKYLEGATNFYNNLGEYYGALEENVKNKGPSTQFEVTKNPDSLAYFRNRRWPEGHNGNSFPLNDSFVVEGRTGRKEIFWSVKDGRSLKSEGYLMSKTAPLQLYYDMVLKGDGKIHENIDSEVEIPQINLRTFRQNHRNHEHLSGEGIEIIGNSEALKLFRRFDLQRRTERTIVDGDYEETFFERGGIFGGKEEFEGDLVRKSYLIDRNKIVFMGGGDFSFGVQFYVNPETKGETPEEQAFLDYLFERNLPLFGIGTPNKKDLNELQGSEDFTEMEYEEFEDTLKSLEKKLY